MMILLFVVEEDMIGLLSNLGGPEMPAVGFGLGIERLIITLRK